MSWEKEVEEIRRRVALAKEMGGADNIKRQHDGGKLTVRERIERLLDAGTFHEYGALAGAPKYEGQTLTSITPANFVGGTGRINGRRVVVGGDDFTVRGGAADANIGNKRGYAELIAHELHIPIIRLVDGTGGGGSVRSFETMKHTYVPANPAFDVLVKLIGEVPVVAGCMGSVAGIGASLQGFMSTLGGAFVGAVIGRQFNGTVVPLAAGSLCCGLASLLFVLAAEKGRLFKGHHAAGETPAVAQVEGAGWH